MVGEVVFPQIGSINDLRKGAGVFAAFEAKGEFHTPPAPALAPHPLRGGPAMRNRVVLFLLAFLALIAAATANRSSLCDGEGPSSIAFVLNCGRAGR